LTIFTSLVEIERKLEAKTISLVAFNITWCKLSNKFSTYTITPMLGWVVKHFEKGKQ
jgi:hypothetical protein